MNEETKHCPTCEEPFPISCFGIDRSRKDGRNVYCKACNRRKTNQIRAQGWRLSVKRSKQERSKPQSRVSPIDKVRTALNHGPLSIAVLKDNTRLDDEQLDVAIVELMMVYKEVRRFGNRFGLARRQNAA